MKHTHFLNSQIGTLFLEEENNFLTQISFKKITGTEKETPILQEAKQQLSEYFEGKRTSFDLPLKFHGTDFQKKCWQALQKIPFGETKSYQEQAQLTGNIKAVRAVGGANNKNPIPIIVPCHRVIGKNGSLVGYAGGIEKKKWLLEHEKKNVKKLIVNKKTK